MRIVLTTVCATVLIAAPAAAQRRTIQLPDTLGANFNIADSAAQRGSATDFDFLDGTWHFTFQSRRPDGAFNPPFTGHWYSTKKVSERYQEDGRSVQIVLVEDQWRPDDAEAPSNSGTYTWRLFSSESRIWAIQGMTTWLSSGSWLPGLAWGDAANRYLVQHRGAVISRIRYFNITPDSFLWRADVSDDGGRTWQLDSRMMQASRIGR